MQNKEVVAVSDTSFWSAPPHAQRNARCTDKTGTFSACAYSNPDSLFLLHHAGWRTNKHSLNLTIAFSVQNNPILAFLNQLQLDLRLLLFWKYSVASVVTFAYLMDSVVAHPETKPRNLRAQMRLFVTLLKISYVRSGGSTGTRVVLRNVRYERRHRLFSLYLVLPLYHHITFFRPYIHYPSPFFLFL